jgi:hypothetical protein
VTKVSTSAALTRAGGLPTIVKYTAGHTPPRAPCSAATPSPRTPATDPPAAHSAAPEDHQKRAHEPALRVIEAWNAEENTHMRAVNAMLGFQPVDGWSVFQLPVPAT